MNRISKMILPVLVFVFTILSFSPVFAQEKNLVIIQKPCLIWISEKVVVNFNMIISLEARRQGNGNFVIYKSREENPTLVKAENPEEEIKKIVERTKECK